MVDPINSNQSKAHLNISNDTHLPKTHPGDIQSASFMLSMHQALSHATKEGYPQTDNAKEWEKYFNNSGNTQEKGSGESVQKLEDQVKALMNQLKDSKLSNTEKVNLYMYKIFPLLQEIQQLQPEAPDSPQLQQMQKEITDEIKKITGEQS